MKKLLIITCILVSGCAATGQNLQSNVYSANQVNTAQAARTIKILTILPAKIEIDNSQQKTQAQVGGALLGAVAGGLGGAFGKIGGLGTAGTTLAGGAVGALAGSLVNDKTLVDGVTIGYSENGNMFTSSQIGRTCEFRTGTAMIVSTAQNETRIQPNSSNCPQ